MGIYDDMRAIAGMDLTRNEAKVLTIYRLEMDEATGQVRGKTQDQLRAMTGLGRSQFSEASGSLQRRGIVTATRCRNAAQIVVINTDQLHQEVRETRTTGNPVIRDSGSPEIPDSGQPEIPDSGRPENPVHDYLSAPVSAPVSAPKGADASARPKSFDGYERVQIIDGRLELFNGLRAFWLEKFSGDEQRLELALMEALPNVNQHSRTPMEAQVGRLLARVAGDKLDRDRRYAAAAASKARSILTPDDAAAERRRKLIETSRRMAAEAEAREAANG